MIHIFFAAIFFTEMTNDFCCCRVHTRIIARNISNPCNGIMDYSPWLDTLLSSDVSTVSSKVIKYRGTHDYILLITFAVIILITL